MTTWVNILMDFIEGLSTRAVRSIILVVVDRLTKYAHFYLLAHPFIWYASYMVCLDPLSMNEIPPLQVGFGRSCSNNKEFNSVLHIIPKRMEKRKW